MFDDPNSPPPALDARGETSRGPYIALAILTILGAGGAAYYFLRPGAAAPGEEPTAASRPTAPPGSAERATAAPAPPPAVPLPPLHESDPFVRERARSLSAGPEWAALLSGDDLVRRFVAALSTVSEGKSPRQALERLPFSGRFEVRTNGGRTTIDPVSFARYDGIAAMVGGADAAAARPLWQLLHPLIESAWVEVAHPDHRLDATLAAALDHLIAAPIPPQEVEVVLREGLWRYADPELEELTPAQQQLVRMGPDNALQVRAGLRRLRALLSGG